MSEGKLPIGWKLASIGSVTKNIQYGYTASSRESKKGIRFLRITDIQNNKVDWEKVPTCEIEDSNVEKFKLLPNDLVFARTGATVGKSFLIKQVPYTTVFASYLIRMTVNKSTDIQFIKYFFESQNYWRQISENSTGIGQPSVNATKLKTITFPFPPLSEQQRIVARLDAIFGHLDVLREKLDRIPELLKNFRQQVLTQAVTGELTKEWREGKDLGEWEETTIGDLFEVKTGGTPRRGVKEYYEGGNIPWVKSGLVKNELIFEADEFVTELAIRDSNVKIFPIDTLLVAMYGEGKTRGQVGWLKIEATTNQAIAALVNETMPIDTRTYVFYYCLSQYNDIRSKAEGGNQPNLNLSKIKEWEISVPPEEEQKEIVSRINSLFNVADKIESQYQSLKVKIDQMPQAVLAKAFRGELVGQDVKEYVREVEELGMVAEGGNVKIETN